MTISEIITAIQHNVDETVGTTESSTTFYTTEQVVYWVNQAIKQLCVDLPPYLLPDLHGTVTGSGSSITLPTDFFKPLELKIDGHIARIVMPGEYWTADTNPYSFADYYGVLFTDSTMEVHPTATSFELKYLKAPTEYSTADTSATPPIPAPYHEAIIHYATYLALRRDKEVAGDFINLYEMAIGRGAKNDA